MTISVLQDKDLFQAGSAATIVLAFTSSVTAGSSIHVIVRCATAGVTYTCSDNINGSYGSPLNTVNDSGNNHPAAHFQFSNSGSGTLTVTVTPSSSVPNLFLFIREIGGCSGFDVSAAHNNNAVGTGTDAVTSTNATPSIQPGLISAWVSRFIGTGTPAAGTGFTPGVVDGATQTEHRRYILTSAAAATATNTVGTDEVGVLAAWFKEAAAAGAAQGMTTQTSPGVSSPC